MFTVPLSVGVASVRYQSIEPLILSFNLGDELTIFSKEAGSNKDLWGAEVNENLHKYLNYISPNSLVSATTKVIFLTGSR